MARSPKCVLCEEAANPEEGLNPENGSGSDESTDNNSSEEDHGQLHGMQRPPYLAPEREEEPSTEEGEENDSGGEEGLDGKDEPWDGGIFARSRRTACVGYLAQYFAVGVIYGGLPATVYGVFLGYLSVPSYVYNTVMVFMVLPWSFKFLFGLMNDTLPIRGQRRRPYMTLGWAFCAAMLLLLSFTPLPPPYWCVDEATGEYVKQRRLANGTTVPALPCHPESATKGGTYALLMMLAALGYVVADVAADGLTVEYAKEEPLNKRGTTQTMAYLTRTIGQACTSLFVGLGMNGKAYNGSFSWGLSFNEVCLAFSLPAALMVPISFLTINEPRSKAVGTCTQYLGQCWDLLRSKAFVFVLLYNFLSGAIGGVSTTAGGLVKSQWAGVKNLQNQMFSLVGSLLFAWGLWLVKRRFLNKSWRVMLVTTSVLLNVVDMVFTTLTVFDVVRNQYFYLGETVLLEVPMAANFVVSTFVVVEMADDGNEGLVYGLLTTAANLGYPMAQALSNQIFGLFHPSLSDIDNYIRNTKDFQMTVFESFVASYGFSFASLACLYFLPNQKEEAQHRKRSWPRKNAYGAFAMVLLIVGLGYCLLVDVLSMLPATMCMRLAGGSGCHSKHLSKGD